MTKIYIDLLNNNLYQIAFSQEFFNFFNLHNINFYSWKRLCMKILILKWFHTVVFCLEEIKPHSIYLLMPFKNGHCISFLFSFFLSFLSGSQIYDPTEFQDKFYPHEQRKEREKNIYEMHYFLPRAKCNPGTMGSKLFLVTLNFYTPTISRDFLKQDIVFNFD